MCTPGYWYHAYGLRIFSEKSILEFSPIGEGQGMDVSIHWRPLNFTPDYSTQDWQFECGAQQATLCFRGVAIFRIPDTRTIIVAKEDQADDRMVERYICGVVFAILLYLRGLIVFHAACVAFDRREAVAFIGDSGAGKSSLAALAHLHGHPCMNDDVTPIKVDSGRIVAVPGIPYVKVDRDFVQRHQIPSGETCIVHPDEEQVYLSLAPQVPQTPVNIRALVFLNPGTQNCLQPISARQAVIETIRYTLPARLLLQSGSRSHFLQITHLAESVPAYTLTRDLQTDSREQLLAIVLSEFAVKQYRGRCARNE